MQADRVKAHPDAIIFLIIVFLFVGLLNSNEKIPARETLVKKTGIIIPGSYAYCGRRSGTVTIVIEQDGGKQSHYFDYLNFTHEKVSNYQLLKSMQGKPISILYEPGTYTYSSNEGTTKFEKNRLWEAVPISNPGGFTYEAQKLDVLENNKYLWLFRILLVLFIIYFLYRRIAT